MKTLHLFLLVMFASLLSWNKTASKEINNLQSNLLEKKVIANFKDDIVDNDKDGIDDKLETWLLERYRPYFKFSSGESIFPIDAADYISQCDFKLCGSNNGDCDKDAGTFMSPITNLNAILTKYPGLNITKSFAKSAYHLSPRVGHNGLKIYSPLPSPGKDLEKVSGNIGLYGHVVPIKLPNPYYYDRNHVPSGSDVGNMYYKVEYWQLCSYNDANAAGIGNHEADWMTVQLIIDHSGGDWKIGTVLYYAHGHEIQFQMNEVTVTDNPKGDQGEKFLRYRGVNFGKGVEIWPISKKYSASLQNNQVRFYPDPTTGEYTHPVVYPEKGSHEYWPTNEWYIHSPTDANGKGLSFLSNNISNLGEVEYPLNEYPISEFVLRYNGFWGCWSRDNSPPPGPSMHTEWTWPANSSIRRQLSGMEN